MPTVSEATWAFQRTLLRRMFVTTAPFVFDSRSAGRTAALGARIREHADVIESIVQRVEKCACLQQGEQRRDSG